MDFENNKADDEWEIYMGLLYSNIIKKELKNKELKNVVELAPGYRYKIAYALKQINFNGDLYVVDNNQDVLNYIKDSYNTILPNAKLHLICCDFDVCHFKCSFALLQLVSEHSLTAKLYHILLFQMV